MRDLLLHEKTEKVLRIRVNMGIGSYNFKGLGNKKGACTPFPSY